MSNLLDELREVVVDLVCDHKLRITRIAYFPERFGNALIELSSPNMTILFLRDRGEIFVDVSNAQGESFPLEAVLASIRITCSMRGRPPEIAAIVRDNFAVIEDAVNHRLEELRAECSRRRSELICKFGRERPADSSRH